jgi:preprotein translocase subunit SecG
MEIALGIALIVLSVALTVMVLFQSSKDTHLSGTIAGGAETFFGKTKGSSIDKLLSKLTIVVSALVVILTVALVIVTNN